MCGDGGVDAERSYGRLEWMLKRGVGVKRSAERTYGLEFGAERAHGHGGGGGVDAERTCGRGVRVEWTHVRGMGVRRLMRL